MLVKKLFDVSRANLLLNNNKDHPSWLSDLKQKRSHVLRNDILNEMVSAACTNNQGNHRDSINSLLAPTDQMLQNAIAQQVTQQNGNTSNVNNQVDNNLTNNPDSSVQLFNSTNTVTPQVPGSVTGNNFLDTMLRKTKKISRCHG